MNGVIIQTSEDLKNLYLQTDITDICSVQSAISEASKRTDIAGSNQYLIALNAATPANIKKARMYGGLNESSLFKNVGWVLMAVFAILMAVVNSDFDDAITTWLSLGFWVGVGVQIYIAMLKSTWNKLTLTGAVIHPMLKNGPTQKILK